MCWPSAGSGMGRDHRTSNPLHLDGDIVGKRAHAHGHSSMSASLAEKLHEQVERRSDLGLGHEVRGRVHVTRETDGTNDAVQVSAERLTHVRQEVQRAPPRGLLPLRHPELSSELAHETALPVPL